MKRREFLKLSALAGLAAASPSMAREIIAVESPHPLIDYYDDASKTWRFVDVKVVVNKTILVDDGMVLYARNAWFVPGKELEGALIHKAPRGVMDIGGTIIDGRGETVALELPAMRAFADAPFEKKYYRA